MSAAWRKISPAMMSAETKYSPLSYILPTCSIPARHSSISPRGSSPAASRSRMAARLPRWSIATISPVRSAADDGVIRLPPPDVRDADRRREVEAVGPADEPAPAHRPVLEVEEEVLDHPRRRARLFAEVGGLGLRERGGVQLEAAVLEARLAGVREEVAQRGHAVLGLDQRTPRVEDEVLAVVEDRLAGAAEDALDGDHGGLGVDRELAAHPRRGRHDRAPR